MSEIPEKDKENGERRHLTSAERHAIYEENARKNAQSHRHHTSKKEKTRNLVIAVAVVILIAVIAILVVNDKVWEPARRYDEAMALYENENYLAAYDKFIVMGEYRDAISLAESCVIENARKLAGRDDVVIGTSDTSPWFSVDAETGELNFDEDKYRGTADIVIPDVFDGILVRALRSQAFAHQDFITSVTIPPSVSVIGERAFLNCSGLLSVQIPDTVTAIGESAFAGCSSLSSLHIGTGLTEIGQRAFKDCSALTSVVIPEGVCAISSRAFNGCSALEELSLPSTLKSAGGYAFTGCTALKKVTFPGTAEELAGIFILEDGDVITGCSGLVCGG